MIDPLDGTVNFLHGVPLFAVSIAAAVDGEVVAGAVVDVLRGELFSAHLGGGARSTASRSRARTARRVEQALVTTGFSYRAEERMRQGEVAARRAPARGATCAASDRPRSSCAGSHAAASTRYYQRDTEMWDRAAGALIAAEAGADVELPCPENGDLVLAAGPGIFEELRALVQYAWD